MNSTTMRNVCQAAGPGCLLAFIFLSLASRIAYPSFDAAFAAQLPLTISGDAGCLAGVACAMALFSAGASKSPASHAYISAFSCAGLCLASLARSGVFFTDSAVALIAGDFFCATFATLCLFGWWRVFAGDDETALAKTIGKATLVATALFVPLAIVPQRVGSLLMSLALPLASCLCFIPFLEGVQNSSQERNAPVPGDRTATKISPVIIAFIALAFAVLDAPLNLFPLSLFHDSDPIGSLTPPGCSMSPCARASRRSCSPETAAASRFRPCAR